MLVLDIPGDYLEGGGQILRTATALSCITGKPIRVFNIRAKRPKPGLKSQHLYTLKALASLFKAETKGLEIGSKDITFIPQADLSQENIFNIDLKTAGGIGLALQPLLLVSAFKSRGISFNLKGGTCGLGAIPVDYYAYVIFPLLNRFGLKAKLEIIKRGYYPKGGGQVQVKIDPLEEPKEISLVEAGRLIEIKGKSIASESLAMRKVAQRQKEKAEEVLKSRFSLPIKIDIEYANTLSSGSEVNLLAYTESNCILWSDSRGERTKSSEEVGEEAAQRLIKEIDSNAAVDFHLADNLIPWLSFLGGAIKTSHISLHTLTNIWVCELFLGKIFEVKDTTIRSLKNSLNLNQRPLITQII